MGEIKIQTTGSFPLRAATFSALEGGHAFAIQRAIEFLNSELLPWAIRQDHLIHEQGERSPKSDFGTLPSKKG